MQKYHAQIKGNIPVFPCPVEDTTVEPIRLDWAMGPHSLSQFAKQRPDSGPVKLCGFYMETLKPVGDTDALQAPLVYHRKNFGSRRNL